MTLTAPPATDRFRLWSDEERTTSMNDALAARREGEDIWVFGYGSLIWRPEFEFEERRIALLTGYHRALCLWSRVNRGTPERPGLVFGLDRGGSCRGVVYRLAATHIGETFPRLWAREMSTGAYLPKWLRCQTEAGPVQALVFVMDRSNDAYVPGMPTAQMLDIVRGASGRYGPCTDYVLETEVALSAAGIHDRRLRQIAQALRDPADGRD